MPFLKLSEYVERLSNPQRSDALIKQLRDAVREGDIDAVDLPERFELPKDFKRRGSTDTYRKTARNMVIDATPDVEAWFDTVNRELASGRRGAAPKPTLENIQSGVVDFKALAEETRRKMGASFEKGQALGKSRATQGKPKPKAAPRPKTAPKRTPKK
ncbi:hypothetical protein [Deinococcus sonorensis]|uniref:Uncharacterized protein n=1 Tax=Deinococcus sonorensis TaxID=309891 RepID=A0ABV8YAF6_9DEIO